MKKQEMPKPVQSLHMHPLKPILAVIHNEGTIRLINIITNTATAWNEGPTSAQDKPIQVTFHPCQSYMIALLTSGTLVCWDTSAPAKDACLGSVKVRTSDSEAIESVVFHGTLPFVLTVNNNGAITTWNFLARKNTWIVKIVDTMGRWELSPAPTELCTRFGHLPNFMAKFANEPVLLTRVTAHPSYNYFTFNFRFMGKVTSDVLMAQHLLDSLRLGVYCLRLFDERDCNMIVPQQQTLLFWATPSKELRPRNPSRPPLTERTRQRSEGVGTSTALPMGLTPRHNPSDKEETQTTNVYRFPNETFFLDGLNLLSYAPAYNDLSLAKKLPALDFEGRLLRPTRVIRSNLTDRFLVFFLRQDATKELTTFGVAVVCRDSATKDITISPAAGQTGIFFGNDDEFLVLSENGLQVEIWKNEEDTTLPMLYELPSPMSDVFWTPLENGNIIWFVDLQRFRIVSSYKTHTSGSKFLLNSQCSLHLLPGEEVCQVAWHHPSEDEHPPLAAIVTTRRVLIVDERLHIIASAQEVASSCLWLGAAVVFKTRSHIQYLTVRNAVRPLISLRLPDAVIMTLLNDRVALAVRRAGETSVVTNAVGLLEPLVIGFLHYFEAGIGNLDRKQRTNLLLDCAESYDARRISWQLIEEVTKHGYREFALQLLLANPHLLAGHHQFAFELALTTYHYSTAFTLIERSPVLKTAPNLYRLQKAAMRLGQFDVARKCAEATSDWTTLLYLYTLARSKEGLLIMKKTLERDRDANAGILTLIERTLQQPEIASLPSKAEPMGLNPATAKVAESHKLLTRQHSRNLSKLTVKNFSFTNHLVLKNMSPMTNKRWHVDTQTQVQCEMRTLPLEGGSGNLVVGPLLLNTLLGDWFTRRVPYFELPGVLQGDSAKREVIMKLLAESQAEKADPGKRRTMTVSGTAPQSLVASSAASASSASATGPVPSLSLAGLNATPGPAKGLSTARGATNLPGLTIPQTPIASVADQRSPRKMPGPNTMRPMSTAAANLINAIANSSSSTKSSSDAIQSPHSSSGADSSSSPTDSDSALSGAQASSSSNLNASSAAASAAANDSTTRMLALAEQALTTDPLVLFNSAIAHLESADYDGCILDMNSVLLSLLAANSQTGKIPSADSFVYKQVQLCARYKLVATLLYRIKKLESEPGKAVAAAHLAQFLADIPVLPHHRLVLLRKALKLNLAVQNCAFAAKCLALLIPKKLPDAASLEQMQEDCKKKGGRDAQPLEDGTKLCVKSYAQKWIATKQPSVVCTLCNASYHYNLLSLAAPCSVCFWRGGLVLEPAVASKATKTPAGANNTTTTKANNAPPSLDASQAGVPRGMVISSNLAP